MSSARRAFLLLRWLNDARLIRNEYLVRQWDEELDAFDAERGYRRGKP